MRREEFNRNNKRLQCRQPFGTLRVGIVTNSIFRRTTSYHYLTVVMQQRKYIYEKLLQNTSYLSRSFVDPTGEFVSTLFNKFTSQRRTQVHNKNSSLVRIAFHFIRRPSSVVVVSR